MLLLTDEEIIEAMKRARVNTSLSLIDIYKKERRLLIKAQLKKVAEWLEKRRVHDAIGYLPEKITYRIKRGERQAILKEAEDA